MTTQARAAHAYFAVGKYFKTRTLAVLMLVGLGLPLGLAAAQPAVQPSLQRDAFLSAVAEVETGGNTRAVGRRGERGLYQFTRATWQRHSALPFSEAHNPTSAYEVAVRHYDWLRKQIAASGREPTTYRLAVAWNAGLGRVLSGTTPRTTRDYARRVSNLAGVWRPPVRRTDRAMETLVAVNRPAPAAPGVAPSVSTVAMTPAPEVAPVEFSLGRPPAFRIDAVPSEVLDQPAEEVTFTLARPETPSAAPPRRFIFATIGE